MHYSSHSFRDQHLANPACMKGYGLEARGEIVQVRDRFSKNSSRGQVMHMQDALKHTHFTVFSLESCVIFFYAFQSQHILKILKQGTAQKKFHTHGLQELKFPKSLFEKETDTVPENMETP